MPKMFSRRNALLKRWPSLGRGARVGAEAPLFTHCPRTHHTCKSSRKAVSATEDTSLARR